MLGARVTECTWINKYRTIPRMMVRTATSCESVRSWTKSLTKAGEVSLLIMFDIEVCRKTSSSTWQVVVCGEKRESHLA